MVQSRARASRPNTTLKGTTVEHLTADIQLLDIAIAEARKGLAEGGVPIGAALIVDGEVVAVGRNRRVQNDSSIHHGETNCLENAGRLSADVYARATMVTTLSPCDMCSGAILLYKIPTVIIGENRTFMGAEGHLRERGVDVRVLDNEECIQMMSQFVITQPEVWNQDIGE